MADRNSTLADTRREFVDIADTATECFNQIGALARGMQVLCRSSTSPGTALETLHDIAGMLDYVATDYGGLMETVRKEQADALAADR
jgi:hypothetical protein